MREANRESSDMPLVAGSYNHTPEDRAAMGLFGALFLLGGAVLIILAACGVI